MFKEVFCGSTKKTKSTTSGTELTKNFATAKILRAKRALPPAGEKFFKFNIAICIICVGKMLYWGHFRCIMKLLLNNYLWHWDILSLRKLVFLFKESAIKPTPLLHANFQMPWRTECNRPNWWRPECFYEP